MKINDKYIIDSVITEKVENETFYWIYKNKKWYICNNRKNSNELEFTKYSCTGGWNSPHDDTIGIIEYISIKRFEKTCGVNLPKFIFIDQ